MVEVKSGGKKDYTCGKCNKPILKGTPHFRDDKAKVRICQECLNSTSGASPSPATG